MTDERSQDQFGPTFAWLLFWLAIGVSGFLYMPRLVLGDAAQIKARADASKAGFADLKQQLSEVYSEAEQKLLVRTREADERRLREAEEAMGGPARAAFADPDYTIEQALRAALRACAPSNALAEVKVDRFTEFTASITTAAPLTTNEMIAVARKFMPLAKDYLDALRFSARGEVIAELDRQDIEFVEDWATAPDARLAMLLPREIPAATSADPKALAKFQEEQRLAALLADEDLRKKAVNVDRAFRAAAQNAYADLKAALDLSRAGISLADVKTLKDLDAREKQVREAAEHAARAKAFWLEPLKVFEKALDDQGLTGETRAALARNFENTFRNDSAKSKALFTALDGLIVSGGYLLRAFEENPAKWRYIPEDGAIAYKEEEFANQTSHIRDQVRNDVKELDEALRDWESATVQ